MWNLVNAENVYMHVSPHLPKYKAFQYPRSYLQILETHPACFSLPAPSWGHIFEEELKELTPTRLEA